MLIFVFESREISVTVFPLSPISLATNFEGIRTWLSVTSPISFFGRSPQDPEKENVNDGLLAKSGNKSINEYEFCVNYGP